MKKTLRIMVILSLALLVGGCLGSCGGAATTTTASVATSTTASTLPGETTIPGEGTESTTTSVSESTTTTAPSTSFTATLTGADMVPAVNTQASGLLTLTFDELGTAVHYVLQVNGLSKVTVAHLHQGAAGANGKAIATLYPGPAKVGVFTGVLSGGSLTASNLTGPLKGKSLDDLLALARGGKVYVEVGNATHSSGAIRGQLAAAEPSETTPTTLATSTMFTASLAGRNEIHTVSTSASGTLKLIFNADRSSCHYILSVKRLSDATVARLHEGRAGRYGEPVVTIFAGPVKTGAFTGVLAEGDFTAKSLTGPLAGKSLSALITLIVNGKVYVNVGSSKYRSGEIRGQVK